MTLFSLCVTILGTKEGPFKTKDLCFREEKIMKKGFTLIELLVVVLIIGILSSVSLPQYQKAVFKARYAEAASMMSALGRAYDLCELETPDECDDPETIFDKLVIDVPGTVTDDCVEDDVCFQTKNWSYENNSSHCFWAYPIENGTINNNLMLGKCHGGEMNCDDDRGNTDGKDYAGMCRVLGF